MTCGSKILSLLYSHLQASRGNFDLFITHYVPLYGPLVNSVPNKTLNGCLLVCLIYAYMYTVSFLFSVSSFFKIFSHYIFHKKFSSSPAHSLPFDKFIIGFKFGIIDCFLLLISFLFFSVFHSTHLSQSRGRRGFRWTCPAFLLLTKLSGWLQSSSLVVPREESF